MLVVFPDLVAAPQPAIRHGVIAFMALARHFFFRDLGPAVARFPPKFTRERAEFLPKRCRDRRGLPGRPRATRNARIHVRDQRAFQFVRNPQTQSPIRGSGDQIFLAHAHLLFSDHREVVEVASPAGRRIWEPATFVQDRGRLRFGPATRS